MPRWDFICDECEKVFRDVIGPNVNDSTPECCGKKASILWDYRQGTSLSTSVFEPFVTKNIHPDGRELKVSSKADLRRYENEFGVTQVDDPNLEARGGKIVRRTTGKRQYFDLGR